METKPLNIAADLYDRLRAYCDERGLRFVEFVEDTLESAPQREKEMEKVRDAEDLAAKVTEERWLSFRRGFWQGFCSGVLSAQGKMGACEAIMPEKLRSRRERVKAPSGGQLDLFKK